MTWVDLVLNGASDVLVAYTSSRSVPGRPNEVNDCNTIVLTNPETTVVVLISMTLLGSSKPLFYVRLGAKKAVSAIRIETTEASVTIPFLYIRPEELHV